MSNENDRAVSQVVSRRSLTEEVRVLFQGSPSRIYKGKGKVHPVTGYEGPER
jgi:hypothetical protein